MYWKIYIFDNTSQHRHVQTFIRWRLLSKKPRHWLHQCLYVSTLHWAGCMCSRAAMQLMRTRCIPRTPGQLHNLSVWGPDALRHMISLHTHTAITTAVHCLGLKPDSQLLSGSTQSLRTQREAVVFRSGVVPSVALHVTEGFAPLSRQTHTHTHNSDIPQRGSCSGGRNKLRMP